jgi:hypothetical protein
MQTLQSACFRPCFLSLIRRHIPLSRRPRRLGQQLDQPNSSQVNSMCPLEPTASCVLVQLLHASVPLLEAFKFSPCRLFLCSRHRYLEHIPPPLAFSRQVFPRLHRHKRLPPRHRRQRHQPRHQPLLHRLHYQPFSQLFHRVLRRYRSGCLGRMCLS